MTKLMEHNNISKLFRIVLCSVLFLAPILTTSLARAEEYPDFAVGDIVHIGFAKVSTGEPLPWRIVESTDNSYTLLSVDCLGKNTFLVDTSVSKYADGTDLFRKFLGQEVHRYFGQYERDHLKPIPVSADGAHTAFVSIPRESDMKTWFPSVGDRKAAAGNGGKWADYWVLSEKDINQGVEVGTFAENPIIDTDGKTRSKYLNNFNTSGVRPVVQFEKDFLNSYLAQGGSFQLDNSPADECLDLSISIFDITEGKVDTPPHGWEVVETHFDEAYTFTGMLCKKTVNDKTRYCFVFKGTDGLSDTLIADIKEIFLGRSNRYMLTARDWAHDKINEIILKDDTTELILFTGHSLGAYTATFVAADFLDPSLAGPTALSVDAVPEIISQDPAGALISETETSATDASTEASAIDLGSITVQEIDTVYEVVNYDPELEEMKDEAQTRAYYNPDVADKIYCYGYSTPGCTPIPLVADVDVCRHFANSENGMYDGRIANYYIEGDNISQFGSHLGDVKMFSSWNYKSAWFMDYHQIQNFYFFKPLPNLLPIENL